MLCRDDLVWVLACRFSCSWVFVLIFSSLLCVLLSIGCDLRQHGHSHHCWCCWCCSCCCCLRLPCPHCLHQELASAVDKPPPRVSKSRNALDSLPWWSEPPCSEPRALSQSHWVPGCRWLSPWRRAALPWSSPCCWLGWGGWWLVSRLCKGNKQTSGVKRG